MCVCERERERENRHINAKAKDTHIRRISTQLFYFIFLQKER